MAAKALRSGMHVHALARSTAEGSAQERVRRAVLEAQAETLQGLTVIEGDITEDGLGIDSGLLPSRIGFILHCAACVEFAPEARQLNQRVNVEGVNRVLRLAKAHRAPLVHVSTAYVAGLRQGPCMEEELEEGQAHRNAYEQSKVSGEKLVREWAISTGIPAMILRPAIVTGDSRKGIAIRFNTIYEMLRAFDLLGPAIGDQEIRIVGNPLTTKNLVPVDYVADLAWELITAGRSGTYHLTHPRPLSLCDLKKVFEELFGSNGVRFVTDDELKCAAPTRAERICHRAMAGYRSYLNAPESVFDRRNLDDTLGDRLPRAPEVDVAYFRRILEYARSRQWRGVCESAPAAAPHPQRHAGPVREYFEKFLEEKLDRALLPDVRRLSGRLCINVTGGTPSRWSVHVQDGVLREVKLNGDHGQCLFHVGESVFMQIVSGTLSPQQAFLSRRAEIDGDMELALRFITVMAQFFRRFPYVPADSSHA